MNKKIYFIIIFIIVLPAPIKAQHVTSKVVSGGSIVDTGNGSFSITGTMGQSLTGLSQSNKNAVNLGFWPLDKEQITAIPPDQLLKARGVYLHPNQPNPAQNNTTISFETEKPAKISLIIYNSMGKKVYTYPEKMYTRGMHEKRININNWPAGIYTLVLYTPSGVDKRKMLVVH